MNLSFFKKNSHISDAGPKQGSATEAPKNGCTTTSNAEKSAEPSTAAGDIQRVHNLIILDESGSMHSIYRPAISGVNETLLTIRNAREQHKTQEHFVSLVVFNSNRYNKIYDNVPAEKAVDITPEQFSPAGLTPLYDAVGRSLTELRGAVAENDVVLVTIITDGYENASREYNGKAIKSLIESLRQTGWVFTYIGANQDVEAVADTLAIKNHMCFETSEESTKEMFMKERASRMGFFSRLETNMSRSDLDNDYFDTSDK